MALVKRIPKGSPLTHTEMDNNLTELEQGYQAAQTTADNAAAAAGAADTKAVNAQAAADAAQADATQALVDAAAADTKATAAQAGVNTLEDTVADHETRITTLEGTPAGGGDTVTDSATNGNILVNGAEVTVYNDSELAADVVAAQTDATQALADAATAQATANGKQDPATTLGGYGITDALTTTGSPTAVNKVWVGTQAQYDAIATKDSATIYHVI